MPNIGPAPARRSISASARPPVIAPDGRFYSVWAMVPPYELRARRSLSTNSRALMPSPRPSVAAQRLTRLLGGHRDRVATYASGSLRRGLTHDQAQHAARVLVEKGFVEMKTQMALPGDPPPAEEIRRVRLVRDAIGPDIKLMCDINQRWRPEQAIDIGSRVEDVGLFWLEDVTDADDYPGLARVTAALKTPIAGGEYVWGIVPFRHMMEARSVDIVMIDLARVGGITQWMKVAAMAEAFNLPVVSHVMPEIHAHLVAACPNGLTVEYMPWMLRLFEETPRLEKGALVLPDRPGLGLRFDNKAVAAFRA